jgi:hypothetical protein
MVSHQKQRPFLIWAETKFFKFQHTNLEKKKSIRFLRELADEKFLVVQETTMEGEARNIIMESGTEAN